jgi:(2Fe-2S) ferredoxin
VGGRAEDCAGGGVVLVVEDMVWYCFVVCEDIREYEVRFYIRGRSREVAA